MYLLLLTLSGFFLLSEPHSQRANTDTTVLTAEYTVSLSGFLGWASQLLGIAPSHLDYREVDVGSSSNNDFQMFLGNKSGRKWLSVSSDTATYSFIDPPHFPLNPLKRDSLRSDVIRFVKDVREFFSLNGPDSLCNHFVLWKDSVTFRISRDPLHPLIYRISSSNKAGDPFIDGSVLVYDKDGILIYPFMELFLHKEGMRLILKMKQMEMEKK